MPAATILCVGKRSDVWPSNTMRPARGGVSPRIERTSVVLPEPLEPSRQVMLPGFYVKRDAFEHVRLVVGGVDALDFQQARHHATPR